MARISFADLQDAFQKAVLSNDDTIVERLAPGARESRDAMLGVYRTAYVMRLTEIVQGDHEQLHAYLGDDAFDELAKQYIAACPSDQPSARWVSRHMPEFLKKYACFSHQPQVAELAVLERALNNAFDCVDAPVAGIEELSQFAPDDWVRLRFTPHSSVVRLDFATNAADIWLALKNKTTPPDPVKVHDRIIVWRNDATPMMRKFCAEEAMMWDEACKGVAFGALCELLAFHDDAASAPSRAATYLQGWLAGGLVSSAALVVDA